MAVIIEHRYSEAIHPIHAILLAGIIPLFLGALLADLAYAKSFNIQWSNFASWLIVGGLVIAGIALVLALIDLIRFRRRAQGVGLYFVLLLITWIVGFLNALQHARDAWGIMPTALILSVVTLILACLTTWLGFSTPRLGVRK